MHLYIFERLIIANNRDRFCRLNYNENNPVSFNLSRETWGTSILGVRAPWGSWPTIELYPAFVRAARVKEKERETRRRRGEQEEKRRDPRRDEGIGERERRFRSRRTRRCIIYGRPRELDEDEDRAQDVNSRAHEHARVRASDKEALAR